MNEVLTQIITKIKFVGKKSFSQVYMTELDKNAKYHHEINVKAMIINYNFNPLI
jgi:hypothetical protein